MREQVMARMNPKTLHKGVSLSNKRNTRGAPGQEDFLIWEDSCCCEVSTRPPGGDIWETLN